MRFLYFLFFANLCTPIFSQPILKIGGLPPKDIFIGIDNPVTLDSIQVGQTYELIAEGLTVIRMGNNQWTVRCYNPGTGLLLLKNASDMVLRKNPVTKSMSTTSSATALAIVVATGRCPVLQLR